MSVLPVENACGSLAKDRCEMFGKLLSLINYKLVFLMDFGAVAKRKIGLAPIYSDPNAGISLSDRF